MADTQNLSTTGAGSGTQTTTQDPQSATQPVNSGNQVSDVQPGVSSTLLTSQGGVTLHPTSLPTVNLNAVTATTTAATPTSTHHHPNTALFGFSGVLFVVAVVLFWSTSRTAKSTTK